MAKKKRALIVNPIRTGETPNLGDILNVARNDSKSFAEKVAKLASERKITLRGVNIRDLFYGLKDVTVPCFETGPDGKQRAITASAFPLLSGLLLIGEIEDAYEEVETIGDELVTEMEDSKKVTVIARLLALDTAGDRVDEGKDFPEIGASEESFEVLAKRNGRKISITQEMIDENDIPNIVERVNRLVEIATTFVEEQTLDAVCDRYGSAGSPAEPYAFRPRPSGPTSLYVVSGSISSLPQSGARAPSGTKITGNALVDSSNLNAIRLILANMRDDRGKRMAFRWADQVLLVPTALLDVATKILNSENEPALAALSGQGVFNQLNNWGPKGSFRPKLVSSPKLDDISASDYFMGNFKKQFRRKTKTAFEYVTLGADTQRFLDARIAFQARVAWEVGINAVDYNRVVKSTT